jgi:ABC-type glutathione transport system ATPase component
MTAPFVSVADLNVRFGDVHAVNDACLTLAKGEILGIVGESGSGKTTLIRAIMGLAPIASGSVSFEGAPIAQAAGAQRQAVWRKMQLVFQDPTAALSPRLTIAQSLKEPMAAQGVGAAAIKQRLAELMAEVGLPADMLDRRPKDLSGGQRQRVAIARALSLKPSLILADEPMSALDVSVKAQIAQLFLDLRAKDGISFIIVAHDLALMAQIADRLIVMHQGRIVEEGPARQILDAPKQPYTQQLRDACLDPMVIAKRYQAAEGRPV